jgi:hypothetical protein
MAVKLYVFVPARAEMSMLVMVFIGLSRTRSSLNHPPHPSPGGVLQTRRQQQTL